MSADQNLARLCVRALSRPTFSALARGEDPRRVLAFLRKTPWTRRANTVEALLAEAFEFLRCSHRTEYVYKSAIANRIVFGRHSPRTSSLLVELGVGKSIIDVAVFNGTSTAYEIKTELDTSRRLATQTTDYLRAFDNVYVVTHPQLVDRYATTCDDRVGILALDKRESLRVVRRAASNACNIEPKVLFRMLRRSEYLPALRGMGHSIEVPNGLVVAHCQSIFEKLARETAHEIFVRAMRARTVRESEFLGALPQHLRVLGYAANLSRPQRHQVIRALETQICFT